MTRPDAGDLPPASSPMARTWTLIGPDGKPCKSLVPGTLGGHRRGRLYGRLYCRAARQAIARGGYVKHRVFFLDEATAVAAGYRPCAVCLPGPYAAWKAARPDVHRFRCAASPRGRTS